MLTSRIRPRVKDFLCARRPRGGGRRAPVFRPRLEALEDRTLLTTVTWDGGGLTSNWTNRFNWHTDTQPDVAPVAGDDLVFPDNADQKINANNFPSGTSFHSLTFSGSGYTISGGTLNVLNLGTGGISNSARSGTSSYNGPIQLDGGRAITVAGGGQLNLGGALSGSGGISKRGPGELELNGADANTYTGATTVQDGVVQLNKGNDTASAIAIPGQNLILSAAGGHSPLIRVLRSEQIADNATVTFSEADGVAQLQLNARETVGGLNMVGGDIVSSGGSLVLRGDVTASPSNANPPAPATISANVVLGTGAGRFTVNGAPGFPDVAGLQVFGDIGGFSLTKEGTGVMELNRNLITTTRVGLDVTVNAGTLLDNDILKTILGTVSVRNDATLGGNGRVSAVTMQGGDMRGPLDNSALGFPPILESSDTFEATAGWTRTTGQGFLNDFHSARPTGPLPGGVGPVETATWTFRGLTPGLYRVFATWPAGTDHTTGAPFSIFDNTALRRTLFVDQEQAPVGGPRNGGIVFQQLGGPLNLTSGTLRVTLDNHIVDEDNGALVIADAIYIERLAGTVSPGGVGQNVVGTLRVTNGVSFGAGSTYRVDFVNTGSGANSVDLLQCGSFTTFNTLPLLVLSSGFFDPPDPGTPFRIINVGSGSPGHFESAPDSNDTIELVDGTGQRHTFTINYSAGDGNDVDLVYQNTATQVRDLTLSPGAIDEGGRVTLRGALTDPNRGDALSLRVDWGDGAVQTFADLGTRPFHFTHAYADDRPGGAPYPVRVEWFDQHGAGNARALSVTVNNVPPRLSLGGAEVVRAGDAMRHTGHFTDPGADTFTAAVDYGDGSGVQPLAVQPGRQLVFEHRYTRPGRYRVTVTVLDDDGGLSTDSFLVIVLPTP